ncbi:MAG: hypothetical protein HY905_13405 [Deltaproteobacteria bacterium]|nr:hypothetical protein [Deltaproteobacteria bacterium]
MKFLLRVCLVVVATTWWGCEGAPLASQADADDDSDVVVEVGGEADVGGDAEAGADAEVGGEAEVGADVEVGGDADMGGDAEVVGDADVVGDSGVDADAGADGEAVTDLDLDGVDDALEQRVAEEYLPFLSVDPDDGCARSIIVFRVRPHPEDATLLHVVMDRLFEEDCGLSGHVGDDEVFAMTVDPAVPAPAGILVVRAISHQDTLCEHVSECGRCGSGVEPCTAASRGGVPGFPVVFYSLGKHGSYMSEGSCDGACFLTNYCTLAPESSEPPMINVGEPGAPLVRDLTAAGMITAEAGWSEADLFGYDPWGPDDFGGAGSVAADLVDDAFLTPACRP